MSELNDDIACSLADPREDTSRAMNRPSPGGVVPPGGQEAAAEEAVLSLDDYRMYVARVFDAAGQGQQTHAFDNFDHEHARAVLGEMVARAKNRVDIYADHLDRTVWDARWLQNFLRRNPDGKLNILTDSCNVLADRDSALFEEHDLLQNPNVTIGVVPERFRTEHMTVVDDRFARVETCQGTKTASVAASPARLVDAAAGLFNALLARSVRPPPGGPL